jgi:hypothetical protein
MSISPPDVQSNASSSPRDAKAELKAAKAYAKALRPWYKKKRFILPLGLIVLAVAAGGASGGGEKTTEAKAGAAETSSPAGNRDEGTSGTVGQALTNAGTTYSVTNVETTGTIGDPDLLGARADGVFVIVSLTLTNNKDETKTFSEASSKVVTSDGTSYETSDKAVLAFGDQSLLLKDIQPDLTTSGKLAFELPPGKVSGSTLVVEDLFGDGEIKVDLGL